MTAASDRTASEREPRFAPVAIVLVGVPVIWSVRLVINFALASHFCFPGGMRLEQLPSTMHWVWILLVVLDLLTMLASAAGAVLCLLAWRAAGRALAPAERRRLNTAEPRTRFLSFWGLLISGGSVIAVLFEFVGLWVIPICG